VFCYYLGAAIGALVLLAIDTWRDHHRTPLGDRGALGAFFGLAGLDIVVALAVAFGALKGFNLDSPEDFLGRFGQGFSVGALGMLALRAPLWNVEVRPDAKTGLSVIYDMARYEVEKEFVERMQRLSDIARRKLKDRLKPAWDANCVRGALERHLAEPSKRSQGEILRIREKAAAASSLRTEQGRIDALLKVTLDFRLTSLRDRLVGEGPDQEDVAQGAAAKSADAERAAQQAKRAEASAKDAEDRAQH
jgi:hypothetical protein